MKSKLYKKWRESCNEIDGKKLKTIDEFLNRSARRQTISFIVSFLTRNATPSNSYGLISTVLFHYPKVKITSIFLNCLLTMLM